MARKYNKKKKNDKKRSSQFQSSRQMKINYPLMPETRLAKVNYTTRIRIDPPKVNAGTAESANNCAIHTFVLNSIYSPDLTTGITTFHSKSGAPKHQPRMYDQWATFYEYATVVGAKVNMCFTTKQRVQSYNTTHTSGETLTGVPLIREPDPLAIGFLKEEYEQNSSPTARFDDLLEKKQLVYKKTKNQAGQYYMKKFWSLKKDPLYSTELWKSNSDGSDVSWGASFGSDISTNNKRYLHIFANPLSTLDDENPLPVDVLIEMEQVVLLSNLRDIAQSH